MTLLTSPTIEAQALEIGHGQDDMIDGIVEGASARRTGFMIWASDGFQVLYNDFTHYNF